jgi:chromate transporter
MESKENHLYEIAFVSLKLGCIGFGGIAGMVSLIENELVTKRNWISREHYLDTVGAANLIPGPNSVEIIMHCARERGGRAGLIVGGILYILPAIAICLFYAKLYSLYGHLPSVQPFLSGIRPVTTALIASAVIRLSKDVFHNSLVLVLSILVLIGSLCGLNDVVLLFAAGLLGTAYLNRNRFFNIIPFPFLFISNNQSKLFFIFLKIGAILYGSGYVLFAYLDDALVKRNHWLTKQQLTDAIAVGQITPGPILSSATFAGYLIQGPAGALIASIGIFLPSFLIAFFLYRLLSFINNNQLLRSFLDLVNGASIALIAAVAIRMVVNFGFQWQAFLIFLLSLPGILIFKINPVWLIIAGSVAGYFIGSQ